MPDPSAACTALPSAKCDNFRIVDDQSVVENAAAVLVTPLYNDRYVSSVNDTYNLRRFLEAQNPVFEEVCAELRAAQKTGHWMWFIFPQLRGLGSSETAKYFAISSRLEAEAYLQHPILGARLVECSRLVTLIEGRSIRQISGYPDDLKFRSSMTLFATISPESQIFQSALQKYFAGELDRLTIERL